MTTWYDAIIIGTGQAGPSLAVRLAGARMKVAIIERKSFGGTCVNTGCIPTKTLVASARAAHIARRAGEYGVMVGSSIAVNMKKVKERKDAVVRRSNEGVEKWLKGTENLMVYEGHARFEDVYIGCVWAMSCSKQIKSSSMLGGAPRHLRCLVSIR